MDIQVAYNELTNAMYSVSVLAENAIKQYDERELAGKLAQASLELVDRLDEIQAWIAQGGPLPGQMQEVQVASSQRHLAKALFLLENR